MADKHIINYPCGATLVYYQQNYNKCTDVNVGFRIPKLDIPYCDEYIGTYKNLVFYTDSDGKCRFPKIKPGIAHFVEHMFFSSLPDMSTDEIYDKLMRTNTNYNASTSQDYVKTEFNCPSKFAKEIFELESKLIFRDSYNKDDIEREKKPIFQELEKTMDEGGLDGILTSPDALTGEEILGIDKGIIDTISEKQLLKFGKTFFTKQNMVITVVSDLPFETIKSLCDEYFVDKAPSIPETKIETSPRMYEFENDIQILEPNKSMNTATIEFILKGSKNYEENALYSNIEDFLLNNFNGRLLHKFRLENGFVYTPYFNTIDFPYQPLKSFTIQTTPQYVSKCVDILTQVIDDLLTNGITDAEFSGFKEMWENRRERKTAIKYNSADSLFYKVIYGEPVFIGDFYEKTKKITKEEINTYIKNIYAKSNLCMIVSGNFDKNRILSIQKVLNKYRPYDKFLDKNYLDHEEEKDLFNYLNYLAKHPDEKSLLHFIGEEKNIEKKKSRKTEDVKTDSNTETKKDKKTDSNTETKKDNNTDSKNDVKKGKKTSSKNKETAKKDDNTDTDSEEIL